MDIGSVVTLEAGYGYHVGQDFSRLTEDVQASVVDVRGQDVYVKLPETCRFAKYGNARFPKRAVRS